MSSNTAQLLFGTSGTAYRQGVETTCRPAARVICLDAAHRLLLLHWRDPFTGAWLWEPPGGGIEPGETPLVAARRELAEETGLDPAAVLDRSVPVNRDVRWNGKRYLGTECFFVAQFADERPALTRTGLLPDEQDSLGAHAWIAWWDLSALPDPVEPPQLPAVLDALVPGHVSPGIACGICRRHKDAR